MSELPKAGEEWFHKRDLFVVKLGFTTRAGGPTWEGRIGWPDGPAIHLHETELERDYARNEPVTLELLERMPGWECLPESDGYARADLKIDDEHTLLVFFADKAIHGVSLVSNKGSELILPDDITLRDLLNVLKVFGVESSVPPAPAENPTA